MILPFFLILFVPLTALSIKLVYKQYPFASQGNMRDIHFSLSIRTVTLLVCFILFFFLSAFRDFNVGNDTITYLELFNTISHLDGVEDMRYEIGYVYLNKLIALFSTNYIFFLIITSFILMLGYAISIIKLSKIVWLSIFLFFILRYFDQSMNLLRQNFAIIFLLIAYLYLRKKRIKQFLLWVVLASCFHFTAIIFLLALLAYKISYWNVNKILIFFSLIGIILYLLCGTLTNLLFSSIEIYSSYADSVYNEGGTRLAVVLQLLLLLIIIFYGIQSNFQDYIKEGYSENKLLLLLLLFAAMFYILSLQFNQISRVSSYFSIFSIYYLPNNMAQLSSRKRYLGYSLIFMIGASSYLLINMLRPQWAGIYPYSLIF